MKEYGINQISYEMRKKRNETDLLHQAIKAAKDAVTKAGLYAYRDRRQKKRQFRALWISKINAAARLNNLSYSQFVHLLKKKDSSINRKVLAELAVDNPQGFSSLVNSISPQK